MYWTFTIAYILIDNVEFYALWVVGGSNVREMCSNTNLLGINITFKHILRYVMIIQAAIDRHPIK